MARAGKGYQWLRHKSVACTMVGRKPRMANLQAVLNHQPSAQRAALMVAGALGCQLVTAILRRARAGRRKVSAGWAPAVAVGQGETSCLTIAPDPTMRMFVTFKGDVAHPLQAAAKPTDAPAAITTDAPLSLKKCEAGPAADMSAEVQLIASARSSCSTRSSLSQAQLRTPREIVAADAAPYARHELASKLKKELRAAQSYTGRLEAQLRCLGCAG